MSATSMIGAGVPGSTLPGDLRSMGFDVRDLEDGERILAAAIIEKFSMNADGELEPLTPGSTRPIASTVTHAGICKVRLYAFSTLI
jgi:hypothetical protein